MGVANLRLYAYICIVEIIKQSFAGITRLVAKIIFTEKRQEQKGGYKGLPTERCLPQDPQIKWRCIL